MRAVIHPELNRELLRMARHAPEWAAAIAEHNGFIPTVIHGRDIANYGSCAVGELHGGAHYRGRHDLDGNQTAGIPEESPHYCGRCEELADQFYEQAGLEAEESEDEADDAEANRTWAENLKLFGEFNRHASRAHAGRRRKA